METVTRQRPAKSRRQIGFEQQCFEIFSKTFEDGLAIYGPDRSLLHCNRRYKEAYSQIRDLLVQGTTLEELSAAAHQRGIFAPSSSSSDTQMPGKDFVAGRRLEACLELTNGQWILRRFSGAEDGSIVEICSDLTEWKRRESALQEAIHRAERAEALTREALAMEEKRNREEGLLSQFNHWLHSCKADSELYQVVEAFLPQLIPGSRGVLYIYNNSRDVLVPACTWNEDARLSEMRPDDCWGLRQGRPHHFGATGWHFHCRHVAGIDSADTESCYSCVPIVAHGDSVGLLHVVPASASSCSKCDLPTQKISEQISLAIANVRLRQSLKAQSTLDQLTGLFNRRCFFERGSRELLRALRLNTTGSVIALDVDTFKRFNDSFGHDAGDAVLKGLARTLKDHFRPEDVVARLGGEEFAVLMSGASIDIATDRALGLLKRVQSMQLRYGADILPPITVSAGITEYPSGNDTSFQDLLLTADKLLYHAKNEGRNRIAVSIGGALRTLEAP